MKPMYLSRYYIRIVVCTTTIPLCNFHHSGFHLQEIQLQFGEQLSLCILWNLRKKKSRCHARRNQFTLHNGLKYPPKKYNFDRVKSNLERFGPKKNYMQLNKKGFYICTLWLNFLHLFAYCAVCCFYWLGETPKSHDGLGGRMLTDQLHIQNVAVICVA